MRKNAQQKENNLKKTTNDSELINNFNHHYDSMKKKNCKFLKNPPSLTSPITVSGNHHFNRVFSQGLFLVTLIYKTLYKLFIQNYSLRR